MENQSRDLATNAFAHDGLAERTEATRESGLRTAARGAAAVGRLRDAEVLQLWANAGLYRWSPNPRGNTFSCVIPSPNPTGELHLGHVLNLSIQDMLCRAHRIKGRDILWAGALDHGSFSTQTVVERQLKAGRRNDTTWSPDELEMAIRSWISQISPRIFEQFRQFGLLMDMDPPVLMSDAFTEELTIAYFLELHSKGLVYEAEAVTDWCPRCRTPLDKVEQTSKLFEETIYTIRYRAVDGSSISIDVRTATPEVVHSAVGLVASEGTAEASYGGRTFSTALGSPIPVLIAERGGNVRGAGLVTPSHCAFSGRLAKRLALKGTRAFDEREMMVSGPFAGESRHTAREHVVDLLNARGSLIDRETVKSSQPACKKCSAKVEFLATRQWFLRLDPLLEPAIEVLRQGHVRVHPKRYQTYCELWLRQQIDARRSQSCDELVDDWCVSRQIQCGPAIPMSRCMCGVVVAGRESRPCPACGAPTVPFSGVIDLKLGDALWVFCANQRYTRDPATLAQIGNRAVCVTGLDLLLYWIMPIVMLGTKLEHPMPIRDVLIHPLVCDAQGNKMGKSVGNVVVPSEIIERYGADCLRLTLLDGLNLLSEKLAFSDDKLEDNRNWLDRLLASGEVLIWRGDVAAPGDSGEGLADLERSFDRALSDFNFSELHSIVRTAIERIELRGQDSEAAPVNLGDALVLLHPLVPITTEILWQRAYPAQGPLAAYVRSKRRNV